MAYFPRKYYLFDNSNLHATWQAHNRDWLLNSDYAKELYYNLLKKYKNRYNVTIYAYCLMSNHPHIVAHCKKAEKFSAFMRIVNSIFARKINKKFKRKGQVVMDRFKSPTIETNIDMIKVMTYVDLNPYKAKMVKHPKNYRWSSYKYYAYGIEDELITPSPAYLELGETAEQRQKVYRDMIDEIIESQAGVEKQPYSTAFFIGDPAWVKRKYEEIKLKKALKKQKKLKKFREQAETANAPPI